MKNLIKKIGAVFLSLTVAASLRAGCGAKTTEPDASADKGAFRTLELEEYIPLVAKCVERMPKEMVIHRLTGDGAKRDLIAPLWSADKKRALNAMRRYFEENDVQQGRLYRGE